MDVICDYVDTDSHMRGFIRHLTVVLSVVLFPALFYAASFSGKRVGVIDGTQSPF